ncbi:hypothetical protein AX16_003201 [Volvariella volvacea WC 439]|nr:hypothetical protein AX16_003201 [Volvariella volvacea WC 439]
MPLQSPAPSVILYRYAASPYSKKVEYVLALKQIPHRLVEVASTLPRPDISEWLGISYRRIPILAIGNDVYCDTSLIISALERHFPSSAGYGTVFPPRKHGGGTDLGVTKAFSQFYVDTTLFPLATALLPWDKFPKSFIQDRSALRGAPINTQAMLAARGASLSQLSSHLTLVEEQLADDREWLFDTNLPGLADISVYFVLAWLKSFRGLEALFDQSKFPRVLQWIDRLSAFLASRAAAMPKIEGQEAAQVITVSPYEDPKLFGFDTTEAQRLGLTFEQLVEIAPSDTGNLSNTTFPSGC